MLPFFLHVQNISIFKVILSCLTFISLSLYKYLRTAVTKFRLSSHSFMVERGRWSRPKIENENRMCGVCQLIEDEYHVLMECKRFDLLRKKYIPQKLTERPSMFKFITFMNNCKDNELRNLSIFCHKVLLNYQDNVLLQ